MTRRGPGREGRRGLRSEGRVGNQRPRGRTGVRVRGQRTRAGVFALPRPPGWTCS